MHDLEVAFEIVFSGSSGRVGVQTGSEWKSKFFPVNCSCLLWSWEKEEKNEEKHEKGEIPSSIICIKPIKNLPIPSKNITCIEKSGGSHFRFIALFSYNPLRVKKRHLENPFSVCVGGIGHYIEAFCRPDLCSRYITSPWPLRKNISGKN